MAARKFRVYPWFDAVPAGLLTRRQLDEKGLKPGAPARARVEWRGGDRFANLYSEREAVRKKAPSPAQLAALQRGRQRQEAKRQEKEAARQAAWEARERAREEALSAMLDRDRTLGIECARQWLALGDGAVILDCETTDLDGYLVELGVLSLDGRVLFDRLINPGEPIATGATQVHGITDAEVAACPSFAAVWAELDSLLSGRQIIAYGVDFDRAVLCREVHRMCPQIRDVATLSDWLPSPRWNCAKELYAQIAGHWSPRHESYRWVPLPGGGHRAIADCRALLELLHSVGQEVGDA